MKAPRKDRWKATASSGDPRLAIDDRYATSWKSKPSKKPWLKIDLGKAATLAGLEVYWGPDAPVDLRIQVFARRQAMDPSLSYAPRRGRSGRVCFPSGQGAIRALDLRRPAGRARKRDRRDQPLWSRRRGVGGGKGPGCGARLCAGEASQRREHHGRLRLCALSARGVHRMGRRLRNRFLGLPLR